MNINFHFIRKLAFDADGGTREPISNQRRNLGWQILGYHRLNELALNIRQIPGELDGAEVAFWDAREANPPIPDTQVYAFSRLPDAALFLERLNETVRAGDHITNDGSGQKTAK